jgi:hypothetical protein
MGERGGNAAPFGMNLVVAGQFGSWPRAGHRVGPLRDTVNTYAR